MKPYWQREGVTLYHGDCLEVLPELEAESVDAVITDPPYNVGIEYNSHDDQMPDYAQWCSEWFNEVKRICKGNIAISIGQANLSLWAQIAPPDWWLAWWKPAAMGRCVVGFNNWEPIAFYGKPSETMCDVIRAVIKPDPNIAGHPCPKPLEWATQQINRMTLRGDIVLDLFVGTGTTGVACIKTNRRFIGVEIDEGYCNIARQRVEEAMLQPNTKNITRTQHQQCVEAEQLQLAFD